MLNFSYKQLIVLFFFSTAIFSQTNDISLSFNGYINWTAIYDSRQTVAAREGHFFLYPEKPALNSDGEDINAANNFNMAVIQTRFGVKLNGLVFLGAKTTGQLETEFMGNSNNDVNGLRLRHAYVNFQWNNINLLFGQTWNPMFITEAYPYQIGSNGGAPFQPFARNPQMRLTVQLGNVRLLGALVTERDYTSTGPAGSSAEYLRNSVLPDIHFQMQTKVSDHLFGLGGEYKQIRPMLKSELNIVTNSEVSSFALMSYGKIKFDKFNWAVEAIYGSNLTSYTMLGGYAVKSINPVTGIQTYTALKTLSLWSDMEYKSFVNFGLFVGYSQNLGADDEIAGKIYARGADIEYLYRIAPRFTYTEGKTMFSFEVEYTSAAFGVTGVNGKVSGAKETANTRIYTSIYYML